MYIPKHYLSTDKDEIKSFIETYSFGILISTNEGKPEATHLPFVLVERGEQWFLISHMAKANQQWKSSKEQEVLVIFSEPHAYISPSHYINEQNVPTWNYLAVHVYGKMKLIEDSSLVTKSLEQMIHTYEKEYKVQWDSLSDEYKSRMQNGIVAFEIEINEIQAKKKLSQNKKEVEREHIIAHFEKSSLSHENTIASFMKSIKV